ncbi:MAG: Phosphotransferase System HPr (HPr) Family [Clostridia bacterium]|jgi:phosphocarrier protein|nr:Phosphotransferase System HPr (HPr) Family [Clostridia bacterium]
MKKFSYIIKDQVGIHARPAGSLVKIAKEFDVNVVLESDGKSADLKKLMAVMTLGIKKGAQVTITVEGPDEEAAATQLEAFFITNL